ncbi:ATP-binding cassette domain-containing protein [Jeotgalibaca caeni]|uniref:ATP-binding cassette domain-containing protein n=1 Tax=Jeotgalibaca caeni TaxID=3028623 RepID=UPI00237DC828|nr:ATP-binding cassette domain-containing protein [Jeotgalibaca caeni]MDE1550043.1 ATP-binding cassette domain-containing protein [Jeotgalibaca caeni]
MIEVRDLYKSYGRKAVLKGVTFTIKPNEITCITGLNGTGKTTLMNCIMRCVLQDIPTQYCKEKVHTFAPEIFL